MKYGGALPMQLLEELVGGGFIEEVDREKIRTGSLDLTPTEEFYRVRGVFLPSCNEAVEQALKRVGGVAIPAGSILEKGGCYVCRVKERVRHMPDETYGWCNPKSSSGRIDLHVRLLADRVSRYDSIPRGYSGPLWMLIIPKTFSVVTPVDIALNQVRFFTQDTRLDQWRLETSFEQDGGFLCHSNGEMVRFSEIRHSDGDGSLILSLGLDFEEPGFEALPTGAVIDLSKIDYYEPEEFFRRVTVADHTLALAANTFYILSTKEYVRVPEKFACEMAPMDERSGELRSHYAGFIDPGWGIGADGLAKGRPLTLEVRSFESGVIIRDGQPIAKIKYERMKEKPFQHYEHMSPNYGRQIGPQLSKHFKAWKKTA